MSFFNYPPLSKYPSWGTYLSTPSNCRSASPVRETYSGTQTGAL